MGFLSKALRDAAHELTTGERRAENRSPLGPPLENALIDRVVAILKQGTPRCSHGIPCAIDAIEITWGANQSAAYLGLCASERDQVSPQMTVRFVCSHDEGAGSFTVGRLKIIDADGSWVPPDEYPARL